MNDNPFKITTTEEYQEAYVKVPCTGCGDDCSSFWDGDNDPYCLNCLISKAEDNANNYHNQDGSN